MSAIRRRASLIVALAAQSFDQRPDPAGAGRRAPKAPTNVVDPEIGSGE
jgi:hypothetical protein